MHARTDINKASIVVFGRSLGGAVSVYLAEKAPTKVGTGAFDCDLRRLRLVNEG